MSREGAVTVASPHETEFVVGYGHYFVYTVSQNFSIFNRK